MTAFVSYANAGTLTCPRTTGNPVRYSTEQLFYPYVQYTDNTVTYGACYGATKMKGIFTGQYCVAVYSNGSKRCEKVADEVCPYTTAYFSLYYSTLSKTIRDDSECYNMALCGSTSCSRSYR